MLRSNDSGGTFSVLSTRKKRKKQRIYVRPKKVIIRQSKNHDKHNAHYWRYTTQTTTSNSGSLGHPVPVTTEQVYKLNVNDSVLFGPDIPSWKHIKAQGGDVTTSAVGTNHKVKAGYGDITRVDIASPWLFSLVSGAVGAYNISFNPVSGTPDAGAKAKAVSNTLAHYIEARNTWRGGNFLAEVRETIHQLHHPLQSFYKATYDFAGTVKRIGKVYAKRKDDYKKVLANAWLAYSFGVSPLISDVNDATDALNNLGRGFRHDTVRFSGKGHVSTSSSSVQLGTLGGSRNVIDKADYTVRYKFGMPSTMEEREFHLNKFGVNVNDIIPAAWEAVPWSFFIDYFTNVGEQLEALRYWLVYPSWGVVTVRNSATRNWSDFYGPAVASGQRYTYSGGRAYTLSVAFSRNRVTDFPNPEWRFKMPGFPSLKWLNIAALTKQVSDSKPHFPKRII
jgi:hypothetical protein